MKLAGKFALVILSNRQVQLLQRYRANMEVYCYESNYKSIFRFLYPTLLIGR